jgi:hypothetical protein
VKRANTLGKRDWRQVNQRFPKETLIYSIENVSASLTLSTDVGVANYIGAISVTLMQGQ